MSSSTNVNNFITFGTLTYDIDLSDFNGESTDRYFSFSISMD